MGTLWVFGYKPKVFNQIKILDLMVALDEKSGDHQSY